MIEVNNYKILFEDDNLDKLDSCLLEIAKSNKIFVITDKNVFKIYKDKLVSDLSSFELVFIIANKKSFKDYQNVINKLFKNGITKKDLLIAFGGGTIGDLTGLIASTIFRGIDYVQVPTTLLSQIDSSIGSKTAIDTKYGKNLVGSFYDPKLVFIDSTFLNSLSNREYNNGFAEAIKMALLFDSNLYHSIKVKDKLSLEDIKTIINYKKNIVLQDPYDNGIRRVLNFGHTFGHAIEKTSNYKRFKHGEAISHGMILALLVGISLGKTDESIYSDIYDTLLNKGLLDKNIKSISYYYKDLILDKKNDENGLNFILLNEIGKYEIFTIKGDISETINLK